jgi:hypothetical protein
VYCTQFVFDFIVTLTLPYLLDAGEANLQSKVGFIYGSCGAVGLVWAFFYLPDMTGRSLEELEEMWAEKVPARAFRSKLTKFTHWVAGFLLTRTEWKSSSDLSSADDTGKVTQYPKTDMVESC